MALGHIDEKDNITPIAATHLIPVLDPSVLVNGHATVGYYFVSQFESRYASAAQGALATSALQPAAIGVTVQAQNAYLQNIANLTPGAGTDGYALTWDNGAGAYVLAAAMIPDDAASDGFAYGRRNAAWEKVGYLAGPNEWTDNQVFSGADTPTITIKETTGDVGDYGALTLLANGAQNWAQIRGVYSAVNDSDIEFYTTTNGGTLRRKMYITDDGNVFINNIVSQTYFLQVGEFIPTVSFPAITAARSLTTAPGDNPHGFLNQEQINFSINGYAYAAFDAIPSIAGANNYDHLIGFQARPSFNSSGTLATLYGVGSFLSTGVSAGAITNSYSFYVADPTGTGTIANNYGLYLASLTKGSSKNFAVYTAGVTDSYFGGRVGIGGVEPLADLHVYNATGAKVILGGAEPLIKCDTADGSDTGRLAISGGGGASSGRGGLIFIYGNEHSVSPGTFTMAAGNVAGSRMEFITAASYTMVLTNNRVGINGVINPLAQLHVDQPQPGGSIPVLRLDQGDDDQAMMEFTGTVGIGNCIEAVGAKTLTTTHFIKVIITGVGTLYIPVGPIA